MNGSRCRHGKANQLERQAPRSVQFGRVFDSVRPHAFIAKAATLALGTRPGEGVEGGVFVVIFISGT